MRNYKSPVVATYASTHVAGRYDDNCFRKKAMFIFKKYLKGVKAQVHKWSSVFFCNVYNCIIIYIKVAIRGWSLKEHCPFPPHVGKNTIQSQYLLLLAKLSGLVHPQLSNPAHVPKILTKKIYVEEPKRISLIESEKTLQLNGTKT